MGAPYSNLESKIEQAAKLVIVSAVTGYSVRSGLDSSQKTLPAVLVHGEKGAETPLNTGNYKCKLTVSVMDNADTVTLDGHRQGAARVFDVMLDEDLAASLSDTVTDFTVLFIFGRDGAPTRVEDRQYISEISMDIYACCSDLVA